ncbi:MAG: hypothetical protein JXA77_13490 [Bacteroidales bacterium]|nr:hypothetical protein [Bacteroidales bacterium]MBN2818483.1 hypothetical protein [Bacteroidales bacterium]
MEVLIAAVVIVGLSFLALGFNIFFRKDGKFPENEVGKNKKMREMGIYCVKCEEGRKFREAKRKQKAKINVNSLQLDIERLSC